MAEAIRWYLATVGSPGAFTTSVLALQRGEREVVELNLKSDSTVTVVRNGRHVHISGAGQGAIVLSGSCDIRGVRLKQAVDLCAGKIARLQTMKRRFAAGVASAPASAGARTHGSA